MNRGGRRVARRAHAVGVGAVVMTAACVPSVVETRTVGAAYPASHGEPTTTHERREGPPLLEANVSGTNLNVALTQRTECRDVSTAPAQQDVDVRRSLPSWAQYLNVAGAAALGGIGAYEAFVPCTRSVNATGPSGASQQIERQCTSDEASSQRTVGYVLLGLSAIPVALFVVNAIRAQDGLEVERATPVAAPRSWQTCATKALPNEQVVVTIGATTVHGTTGADGRVSFDLTKIHIEPSADLLRSQEVQVRRGDLQAVTVRLATLPDFTIDWENVPVSTAIEKCSLYLEWQRYREHISNHSAFVEFQKGGDAHGAREFCNMLFAERVCPSAVPNVIDEHRDDVVCGGASQNDASLLLSPGRGTPQYMATKIRLDVTEELKRLAQLARTDAAVAFRVKAIRANLESSSGQDAVTVRIPPGTTEDLKRVEDVLPGFRSRGTEQDRAMNWQDQVVNDFSRLRRGLHPDEPRAT